MLDPDILGEFCFEFPNFGTKNKLPVVHNSLDSLVYLLSNQFVSGFKINEIHNFVLVIGILEEIVIF